MIYLLFVLCLCLCFDYFDQVVLWVFACVCLLMYWFVWFVIKYYMLCVVCVIHVLWVCLCIMFVCFMCVCVLLVVVVVCMLLYRCVFVLSHGCVLLLYMYNGLHCIWLLDVFVCNLLDVLCLWLFTIYSSCCVHICMNMWWLFCLFWLWFVDECVFCCMYAMVAMCVDIVLYCFVCCMCGS